MGKRLAKRQTWQAHVEQGHRLREFDDWMCSLGVTLLNTYGVKARVSHWAGKVDDALCMLRVELENELFRQHRGERDDAQNVYYGTAGRGVDDGFVHPFPEEEESLASEANP